MCVQKLGARAAEREVRLGPLRLERGEGGHEGDDHERDLEVDVGQDQAGQLVEPGAVREDVDPERVQEERR